MKKILNITSLIASFLIVMVMPAMAQDQYGGMTLYTLRNEMGTDPQETLQKVADIGYKYVEAVDYKEGKFYGMKPKAFKKALNDLGMEPLSVHMGSVNLENVDKQVADVKAAGFKYFVAPVPPMGLFKYDRENQKLSMSNNLDSLVDILNVIGKKCEEAGLEFLYHNHSFEFEANEDGIIPIDYMLEKLDPQYVNFQMDLYWVTKAGADPVAYFEKYPGRFKLWHVKDMDKEGRFAPVGTGSIDFKRILAEKKQSGMEYYIVEQDQTYDGLEPLEAITISHKALKKIGFK